MSEPLHQRDDFSSATKRALAERVAFRCSFPECSQITIGPSEESLASTSNVGMACHIAAASGGAGARRYDASMSREARSSIENGIWMCYTHGKLIDTDDARFTIEKLKGWKAIAERRTQLSVDAGADAKLSVNTRLIAASISIISQGQENETIGNALLDSCMAEIWGREVTDAIRDTCIEISRNALTHGGATLVTINVERHCVRIADNGVEFNPWSLGANEKGRGGAIAVRHVKSHHSHQLFLEHRYTAKENQTTMALICSSEQVCALTPCYIKINHQEIDQPRYQFNAPQECSEIYLLAPRFISISDVYGVKQFLDSVGETRPLVFVTSWASALAISTVKDVFPNSRTIIETR